MQKDTDTGANLIAAEDELYDAVVAFTAEPDKTVCIRIVSDEMAFSGTKESSRCSIGP